MIDLARKLARLGRPRVLVIGDLICDVDLHGRTTRYAQEAPVPVFEEARREERPGGAGAVAAMCRALGADVELLTPAAASVKTRYFVDGRPVWRADADAGPISAEEAAALAYRVTEAVAEADAVLIADYGKAGARAYPYLRAAIDGAAARGVPCIVDPARGTDWLIYEFAACIKCNALEWEAARKGDYPGFFKFIVTDESRGLTFLSDRHADFPARPRAVVDVTGAGDMVLAALGVCIACGVDWPDACRIANAAAGLKVERHGAVPVSRAEVVADLLAGLKVLPADLLPAIAQAQRDRGRKVVFTNGCYDLLHAGHLFALETARKFGDCLIVGLNSDASVRRLKGPGRPVKDENSRTALLAGLSCVDAVCLFDAPDPAALLALVRPDVYVQGEEYRGQPLPGAEHAGEVVYVPRVGGHSTTATVGRRALFAAGGASC